VKTEVILPKLGFSMTEAELNEWLADTGSQIVEGQPLYSIESDKSVQEVEAPASGILTILAPIGATYPVGHLLATIES